MAIWIRRHRRRWDGELCWYRWCGCVVVLLRWEKKRVMICSCLLAQTLPALPPVECVMTSRWRSRIHTSLEKTTRATNPSLEETPWEPALEGPTECGGGRFRMDAGWAWQPELWLVGTHQLKDAVQI